MKSSGEKIHDMPKALSQSALSPQLPQ